jgi:hypothetical protein
MGSILMFVVDRLLLLLLTIMDGFDGIEDETVATTFVI